MTDDWEERMKKMVEDDMRSWRRATIVAAILTGFAVASVWWVILEIV